MAHLNKKPMISKDAEKIKGRFDPYKDWIMDQNGYILIRANKKKGLIELGFCKRDNLIEVLISGKTPQEVYFTACQKGLLSRPEHIAYMGKELEKAYLALKYDWEYVQDEELEIKKRQDR